MPWSHLFNMLSLKASWALAFHPQSPQNFSAVNDTFISQNPGPGKDLSDQPLVPPALQMGRLRPQRS